MEIFRDVLDHSFMDISLCITFKLLGYFLPSCKRVSKVLIGVLIQGKPHNFTFPRSFFPTIVLHFLDHLRTFLIMDVFKFEIDIFQMFNQFHRNISVNAKLNGLPRNACLYVHIFVLLLIYGNHSIEGRWVHLEMRNHPKIKWLSSLDIVLSTKIFIY